MAKYYRPRVRKHSKYDAGPEPSLKEEIMTHHVILDVLNNNGGLERKEITLETPLKRMLKLNDEETKEIILSEVYVGYDPKNGYKISIIKERGVSYKGVIGYSKVCMDGKIISLETVTLIYEDEKFIPQEQHPAFKDLNQRTRVIRNMKDICLPNRKFNPNKADIKECDELAESVKKDETRDLEEVLEETPEF